MDTQGRRGRVALREAKGATDIAGTTLRMYGDELLDVLSELEACGRITFFGEVIRFSDHLGGESARLCRNRMAGPAWAAAQDPRVAPRVRGRVDVEEGSRRDSGRPRVGAGDDAEAHDMCPAPAQIRD